MRAVPAAAGFRSDPSGFGGGGAARSCCGYDAESRPQGHL